MSNTANVTTISTTATAQEIAEGLAASRITLDREAQTTALEYMVDREAQRKKLTNGHKRNVERALASGDIEALTAFVEQAQNAGISF